MMLRICRKCGESKPASPDHFFRRKTRSDGLDPWCKSCRREVLRRDGRHVEYYRREREKNAEKRRAQSRDWWAKNGPVRNAKVSAQRAADPQRFANYSKSWREKHPERAREAWWRWAASERGRSYFARPMRRLRNAVSSQVRAALGGKGGTSIEMILGYSIVDLMSHLERQFAKGMSWSNYGSWHIDHILPLSKFQIVELGDDEFRAAWALTNLRPLWADINVKKGARREHLL